MTACATSPEEQARREAERQKAQRTLEINLANQCDPQVADLMKQIDNIKEQGEETNNEQFSQLNQQYKEKINEPLFYNCYKLAWENYLNQRRLEALNSVRIITTAIFGCGDIGTTRFIIITAHECITTLLRPPDRREDNEQFIIRNQQSIIIRQTKANFV